MKKYYYTININIPNDARNVTINLNSNKNELCHYEKHEETDLKKQELKNIINELTEIAKYFDCPIITAQQLNRSGASVVDAVLQANKLDNDDNDICLGNHVTEEQSARIADSTFKGLPIGAYWNINGTKYRIMAHDQFYAYKDITTHHVVVMPDDAYSLQKYNTGNTNGGGYYNSELKSYIEETYNPYIISIFGVNHILSHTHDLTAGYYNGSLIPSSDTKAWLINSYNLNGYKYDEETTYDWSLPDMIQFPAFKYNNSLKVTSYNGSTNFWWLGSSRSSSSINFCTVSSSGTVTYLSASAPLGVRPAFLVY